jgi:hypothetical protein
MLSTYMPLFSQREVLATITYRWRTNHAGKTIRCQQMDLPRAWGVSLVIFADGCSRVGKTRDSGFAGAALTSTELPVARRRFDDQVATPPLEPVNTVALPVFDPWRFLNLCGCGPGANDAPLYPSTPEGVLIISSPGITGSHILLPPNNHLATVTAPLMLQALPKHCLSNAPSIVTLGYLLFRGPGAVDGSGIPLPSANRRLSKNFTDG